MSKKKNRSGFSLIEVMVAFLVLVVLVLGAASVMYQTGGKLQVQGHASNGMELINEVMERAASTNYSLLASATNTFTRDGISYDVSATVTEINSTVETNSPFRKNVAIRVSYKGRDISADTVVIPATSIE